MYYAVFLNKFLGAKKIIVAPQPPILKIRTLALAVVPGCARISQDAHASLRVSAHFTLRKREIGSRQLQ